MVFVPPGVTVEVIHRTTAPIPGVVLQALVTRETEVADGWIVTALEPAWVPFGEMLRADPQALHNLTPQQFEELIAATYDRPDSTKSY